MIELADGDSAASPRPMPRRAADSCAKLLARPQNAVIEHQNNIARPAMVLRL
jgi:hypothetical protein